MAQRLQTYLRTYRKRSALTQEDLSTLLGCESGVSVCQYERLKASPSLEAALACRAIFDVSVEELFPGIYQKVVADVLKRVRLMSKELPIIGNSKAVKLKRGLFDAIVSRCGGEHQKYIWTPKMES